MINFYSSAINSFGKKSLANSQSSVISTWMTSRMHFAKARHLFITAFVFLVISQIGFAQPAWQSSSTATGSSTTVNLTAPSGITIGDLMVACVMVESGSSTTISGTGWTSIQRTDQSSNVGLQTFWKIYDGTAISFSLNSSKKWAAGVSRITGASTAAPINVVSSNSNTSGNPTALSVNTTFNNCLVLAFFTNKTSATYTNVTTERYDAPNTTDGLPSNMMASFDQATAGSTGNRTATASVSGEWCAQQVAINDISNCTNGTWIGTTNTDWFETSNWCGGILPTSTTDIIISAAANQPTINGAGAVCRNITINAGASLTISGSNTLTVYGNWTKTGTFTQNSSTVDFAGTGNIGASNFNHITFSGAGTKTASGILTVAGNLLINSNFTGGSFTHTVGGNWSNNGTYSAGSGVISFNGTVPQSIGGTSVTSFAGLTIANTNSDVTAGNNITVTGTLTINSGAVLDLATFNLGSPSSLVLQCGASTGSIINGSGLLTLGGNVTVNDANTGTDGSIISCPIALGATRTFTVADDGTAATDLTLSGVISGATFGITKAGAGTLILSGLNTYTGLTTISVGTLKLGASTAVNTAGPLGSTGTGTTVTAGATLDLCGNSLTAAATEALTLNGTGVGGLGALTNSASTTSTFIGAITFATAASIVGEAGLINITGTPVSSAIAITLGGTAGGSFSTVIAGARTITKQGTGTWTLSGSNTYSGVTTISAGTLKLGVSSSSNTSGPLGTSAAGTTVASGASLDLNGSSLTVLASEPLSLNGTGIGGLGALTNSAFSPSTFIGGITFVTAASIVGEAGLIHVTGISVSGATAITLGGTAGGSFTTVIAGTGRTITKEGTGTWTLSALNTYTGVTTISAGILKVGISANAAASSALGSNAGGTTVASGASLDLNGSSFTGTATEPLSINGTGIGGLGALTNSLAATSTYIGAITFATDASIVGEAGLIQITGTPVSGTTGITLGGTTGGSVSTT